MAYVPGQAYPPQPGLPAPSWLAGTADRERAVGILRAGFTEGRLSQDELDERVGQAYEARTYAQLWAVTSDLPAGPYPGPQQYGPQQYGPGPVAAPDSSLVVPSDGGNWQSAAALLLTALVIFTLAALVTAIVTAHVQPGFVSPGQHSSVVTPFHPVQLTPYIKRSGPGIVAGSNASGTHH